MNDEPTAQRQRGFPIKKTTILSVSTDGTAVCQDQLGRTEKIPVARRVGKGPLPVVGETWMVDKSMGFWIFTAVAANESIPTITGSRSDGTALTSLLTALADAGLIIDRTTS